MKTNAVVPLLPSSWATSEIEAFGTVSSFWIEPVPWPSSMPQPELGLDRVRSSVSLGSKVRSPLTVTIAVWVAWPSAKTTGWPARAT